MRYNHESYLPIGAFQPILGRIKLYGGGGNPLDTFSDMIGTGGGETGLLNMVDEGAQGVSDVFAGADDLIFQPVTAPISQVTSALDDAVVQPITAPISEVGVAIDDAVADVIPGGWGTIAQVAAAATGNPYIIGATSAGVNFARNKAVKILHNSAGCKLKPPAMGIQLLDPFIFLPNTKVASMSRMPAT
jgi:hypothetical protein